MTQNAHAKVLGVPCLPRALGVEARKDILRRVQPRQRLRVGPSPLSRAVVPEGLMELEGGASDQTVLVSHRAQPWRVTLGRRTSLRPCG